jgi:hypothetical protein
MKRYMNVVNNRKRGAAIEVPDHAQPPEDQWQLLKEDDIEPVDGSEYIDGQWIAPAPQPTPVLTSEEKAYNASLARVEILKKTDAEAVSKYLETVIDHFGIPLSGRTAAIRQYRKALRDLPTQPNYPDEITWPTLQD